MIDGTYNVMLKTPMGVKKGELVLVTDGSALRGAMVVKGVDNPFTSGSVNGDEFAFSGDLKSSVGKLSYECTGIVDGDALTATEPAKKNDSYPMSATLWKNIAAKKDNLGAPDKFFGHPDKSSWMTFNCTFKGNTMMDWLEKYTHNKTGEGVVSMFTGSPWHFEMRNPLPPYFQNQPDGYSFLWVCAFYPDKPGRFVKKSEYDCNGMEILEEIIMSLPMEDEVRAKIRSEVVAAIPVILPYTNAHFMPRALGDRPLTVPEGSTNLGFTGQYCEVPEDCVFTEEYSVRAARMAVYKLLGLKREVAPVKPIRYDARIILAGLLSYLK